MATAAVKTPVSSPWGYAPAWRHELAKAAAAKGADGAGELYRAKADKTTLSQYRHLRKGRASDDVRLANDLFMDVLPRSRAEALLLCHDMTTESVAELLAVPAGTIKTFERLFFNVRDEAGNLSASRSALDMIALGGAPKLYDTDNHEAYWKVTALDGGVKPLLSIWGWRCDSVVFGEADMVDHFSRSAFRVVDSRLRSNSMDSKSLAQMVNDIGSRIGKLRDSGLLKTAEPLSDESLALKMLGLVSFSPMNAQSEESAAAAIGRMRTFGTGGAAKAGGASASSLDMIDAQIKGLQHGHV
jgi:hypothetical protein